MIKIDALPNKMFLTQKDLRNLDFSYFKVQKMIKQVILKKINKDNYVNNRYTGEVKDFYYVSPYTRKGVVCLLSAAIYYNLSHFRPHELQVAVENKYKVTNLPAWPKIRLFYFSQNRYSYAIDRIIEDENEFLIYNIEKTVCDLLVYRKKFAMEESIEVLKNYINSNQRDLDKLIRYSKDLKCYHLLSRYLEVLV